MQGQQPHRPDRRPDRRYPPQWAAAEADGAGSSPIFPSEAGAGGPGRLARFATLIPLVIGAVLLGDAVAVGWQGSPTPDISIGHVQTSSGYHLVNGRIRIAAPPVELVIPSIKVDARLIGLRVRTDGELGAPANYDDVGWYSDGYAPGDPGPAVIAGHVDSKTGPAAFFHLRELRPGDPIRIRRADGTVITFFVDAVAQYPKDKFPTEIVYGSTNAPGLRLVTCGGSFDRKAGHYRDNLVVFARPAPR